MGNNQLDSDLAALRWHDCPDKLSEAETLQRVLDRTGWSQRKLAAEIEWNQPQVSRRLALLTTPFRPRPLEHLPLPIGRSSRPPPAVARHKLHVLWCAHQVGTWGWLVSMEHPIERGLQQAPLRCDLVLSRPGRWRPAWAIEVKRTLPRWQLNEAFDKLSEYAGRLECAGLLVVSHVDDGGPGPGVPAEVLATVVGAP